MWQFRDFFTIFFEHNPFYGDNAGTLESLEEFFLTSVKEVVFREDSTDGVQCADSRLREAGAEVVYCLARGAPKGPNLPRARLNHQDALFPGHGKATHSQTWAGEPAWLGVRGDATLQTPAFTDNTEWTTLSPRSLWEQLRGELHSYYGWEFPAGTHVSSGCPEDLLESLGVHKCVLLRSLCLKCGLQLLHREYALEQRTRAPFTEEDVVNVFPVAKHVHPRATDAYSFYLTGQGKIQQGLLREGYELISEALNLMNNVYGAMHPEIAQCLRLLARLNYVMGDYVEAMAYQQKAVLMSERVNGIDHPYTITEYTHLALYCFANSQVTTTLKLLYRARYLMLLVCGELHPEMPVLDSNIGLILHAVGEYDLSLRFLENALQLNIKFYGSRSLKVAVSYHLVARAQSCLGDFRGALHNEKETYTIYKTQLGEEHDKTRESSECLRHLTQQAVVLQKKINDIYKKNTSAALPPIQIQAPSQSNVLEMLNIINGILFVQIRPQDIENFKAELERRQQQASSGEVEKHAVTAGKESNCVVETPTTAEVAAETSR
ncbi:clustered mitochondria protein homolog [Ixodes scapularis]